MLNVDATKDSAVGVELHCRHLSSARDGWVVGTATPDKLGKNIHFWKVQIVKEEDPSKIICEGSCTVFVRVG
jgi:1,4-dihydroxy-2-naphthoyl-CoA hydrolase